MKVPRKSIDGELYWHVHKKLKRNQNKMETTIGLYGKGNEIISWCLLYEDHVLFWMAIVVTCVVVVEAHCKKSVQVRLATTMSTKVRKSSLMMTISTHLRVWQGQRWETILSTWAPFFNAIIAIVFQNVSWVAMCSLLHGQHSKCIPKSLMLQPH